jgi:hypothetical protein
MDATTTVAPPDWDGAGAGSEYSKWMGTTPATPASCTECGACCYGDGPRYVRVSGADYQRLGDVAPRVTQFIGNHCHMLLLERRCVALFVGVDGQHCGCSVYASRPEPCRVLERGSVECSAVIEREKLYAAAESPDPLGISLR